MLQEFVITCTNEKKAEYLYYFLCRSPGRTLVFVNAISSIRRLTSRECAQPRFFLCLSLQFHGCCVHFALPFVR